LRRNYSGVLAKASFGTHLVQTANPHVNSSVIPPTPSEHRQQTDAGADERGSTCCAGSFDSSCTEPLQLAVSAEGARATSGADSKVALTIVTQSQAQLSLQQHLDIAPDILNCSAEELEGELQPLMMAQAVPNPPNDKKRVKVYELRNNDWFDRGTGFCTAQFLFVCVFYSLLCASLKTCAESHFLRGDK
jgi:hypothetical protein